MNERIQPLGSRVLLKVVEDEPVTKSGIVLPDTAKEKPQRAEVVAIGDDAETIKVQPGDTVIFPKYSGTEVRLEGQDYLLIEFSELLAVVKQSTALAAAA